MTVYFAEYAWTGGAVARDVRIEVADGTITAVTAGAERDGSSENRRVGSA